MVGATVSRIRSLLRDSSARSTHIPGVCADARRRTICLHWFLPLPPPATHTDGFTRWLAQEGGRSELITPHDPTTPSITGKMWFPGESVFGTFASPGFKL